MGRFAQVLDGTVGEALAPNQSIVTLDKAHASRRFLSRTFKCDDAMANALDKYIMSKNSIVSVIHNSLVFSQWFDDFVKALGPTECIGGAVSNLGMAKHRFNSLGKRLGRFVGKFWAVVQTAERIRITRTGSKGSEATTAIDFLDTFSPEEFILLSMMADAADEGYVFTCFCDDEEMDIALQSEEVAAFVQHCE